MVGDGRLLEGLEDSMARKGVYKGGFGSCGEGEEGKAVVGVGRVERFEYSRRRGNMRRITGERSKGIYVYMEGVALIPGMVSLGSASKTVRGPPLPSPTCHPSCFSPPATRALRRHIHPSPPPSPSLNKPLPPLLSSLSLNPPLQQISPDACRHSHQKKKARQNTQ